ncbi:MAG: M20 family metallopeptidase [Chloroflexi bacterium]|nr:MAG: M20 family metallopeptidase [Chloroflexota bacterium]
MAMTSSTRWAASRRRSGDAFRAAAERRGRGSRCLPNMTRCRGLATAAVTTRWLHRGSARRSGCPRSFAGEIVFLGTPAEERGSGKQIMIDDGLFEGIDAALLYHPCDRTHVESAPLASEDVAVTFIGLQAHAASDPWKGKNALDALVLLFSSVGLWRQQLRTDARVHGIVTEGGTAANIIPERAAAWFMLRSPDQGYYDEMKQRFQAMAEGAAMATDTTVEVVYSGGAATMNHNRTIMANVSWVCPTIHPEMSIVDQPTAGHSTAFRDAAAEPRADETTLLAATLVAQTAYDLLADPSLVEAAWREFRTRT